MAESRRLTLIPGLLQPSATPKSFQSIRWFLLSVSLTRRSILSFSERRRLQCVAVSAAVRLVASLSTFNLVSRDAD